MSIVRFHLDENVDPAVAEGLRLRGLNATTTVAMLVAFDLRVWRYEERFLARIHGAEWEEYRRRVRRW